jgi:tRNA threonylcarbamoyladenosine biosynthesis protein TsaE
MRIIISNLKELRSAAEAVLKNFPDDRIFAFYGAMGSGKTTIIKAVCEYLGAADLVSSPTFTIVNEYRTRGGSSLYHIDFYRIRKPDEVFDFGIEEYLSDGSYCFMEWPELVESILPENMVRIRITVGENEERILDSA